MTDETLPAPREGGVPGVYSDVPSAEYHAWPHASASRLKILRDKSPAHLRWALDHPQEPTQAMIVGEATHYAVLQPALFEERYALFTGEKRSNEQKERWAALEAAGKTVIRESDWTTVLAIREAVQAHPKARAIIEGDAERSLVWDDESGVRCQARLDLLSSRTPTIVDLKTTVDASRDAFRKAIWNYGYHIQAAHYLAGARVLGLDVRHFVIVAVEKEPPYGVAVYRLMEDVIGAGDEERSLLLGRWRDCVDGGVWPSYPERVQPLVFENWMHNQVDRRVGAA
jgi:hypothetical protein